MNTTQHGITILQLQQILRDLRDSMQDSTRDPFRAGVMAALSLVGAHANLAARNNALDAAQLAERGNHNISSTPTTPVAPSTAATPTVVEDSNTTAPTKLNDILLDKLLEDIQAMCAEFPEIGHKYFAHVLRQPIASNAADTTAPVVHTSSVPEQSERLHPMYKLNMQLTKERDSFATKLYRAQRLLAVFGVHVDPSTGLYEFVSPEKQHSQLMEIDAVNRLQKDDQHIAATNSSNEA